MTKLSHTMALLLFILFTTYVCSAVVNPDPQVDHGDTSVGDTDLSMDGDNEFIAFNQKFKRKYKGHKDFVERKNNFAKNHKFIVNFNKHHSLVKLGHNQFSDMSKDKRSKFFGAADPSNLNLAQGTLSLKTVPVTTTVSQIKHATTTVSQTIPMATTVSQVKPLTTKVSPKMPVITKVSQTKHVTTTVSQIRPVNTKVFQTMPVTTTVSQMKPVSTNISQMKPVTTTVYQTKNAPTKFFQKIPVTTTGSQMKPVTTPVSQMKPVATKISRSIPATTTVSQSIPVTSTVSQSIPVTSTVSQSIPVTSTVSQTIPVTSSVSQTMPVTTKVSPKLPVATKVSQILSVTTKVSPTMPATTTVPHTIPVTTTVPEPTENLSQEPTTVYASDVTNNKTTDYYSDGTTDKQISDPFKNWTAEGYVTSAKDQGPCGSCWAYSSVGAIEAAYRRITNNLTTFAGQQLPQCMQNGCRSKTDTDAYRYVNSIGGLATDATFSEISNKFSFNNSVTCEEVLTDLVNMTLRYSRVAENDAALLHTVGTIGPVSVSIKAEDGFHSYNSGIINATDSYFCGTSYTHAVLVVGYGTDSTSGVDYWIIKNSWGSSWGEEGFFRMTRTRNACGLTSWAFIVNLVV